MHSIDISPETKGEVEVTGWIHEIRDLGGITFLLLRDREGITQITLPKRKISKEILEKVKKASRESVLRVKGNVQEDGRAPNGFEILPSSIEILAMAKSPLPLDPTEKVSAEIETRLDQRFLDMRRPRVKAIFMIRSYALRAIREFFYKESFIEVNTPKIVATATEGGTALFPISYFEREAFLNQSPQLYKQMLMSSGFEKVFEIGPIFRAEEHSTRRHLNEATSIDMEMSYADDERVMRLLEELIYHTYKYIAKNASRSLRVLEREIKIPDIPFKRISYDEAIEISDLEWGDDFGALEERKIGESMGEHYFIRKWPLEIKPYYTMPCGGKEEGGEFLSKSFDLMHPRAELASGSQRVHDHKLLEKQIEERGFSPESFFFYLNTFKYGMPPHAGWGLGLERLLMTMLDLDNIREAVMFPRDRRRLVP